MNVVKARKDHRCVLCERRISKGQTYCIIVALESQIANDDVEVTGRDNVTRMIPEGGDQE